MIKDVLREETKQRVSPYNVHEGTEPQSQTPIKDAAPRFM